MITALVASLALSAISSQDSPGRIAFVSDRDGNEEIYVMSADGSNPKRLTNDKGRDTMPCWSPDGKRIAWASNRSGDWDIWTMNSDGSDQTNLTHDKEHQDTNPMWMRSDDSIAFVSNRHFYTIRPDGEGMYERTGLLLSPDAQPSISPLALRFCLRDGKGQLLLREGYEVHTVVNLGYGKNGVPAQIYHPSFSSDGANIIFDSGGPTSKIYTIDLRDTKCDQVMMEGNGTDPVFSNEDTAVVFTGPVGEGKGSDIFSIDLDAAQQSHALPKPKNLTKAPGNDSSPAWWEPMIDPRS